MKNQKQIKKREREREYQSKIHNEIIRHFVIRILPANALAAAFFRMSAAYGIVGEILFIKYKTISS